MESCCSPSSRPLLSTNVDDVEQKLSEHQVLASEVTSRLDKVREVRSAALASVGGDESGLPASVAGVLNVAQSLLHSMPAELEERKQYLEAAKQQRAQYDSLVERLNSWVEEAQLKLRPVDAGVDFANVEAEWEEHKKYFGQETRLRDLLDQIHDTANKIWASLEQQDQDKVGHEQEFFNQLVKNTLNSAHSRQAELEEHVRAWRSFRETREQVSEVVEAITVDTERPTSLAGVKSAIARIDASTR